MRQLILNEITAVSGSAAMGGGGSPLGEYMVMLCGPSDTLFYFNASPDNGCYFNFDGTISGSTSFEDGLVPSNLYKTWLDCDTGFRIFFIPHSVID